MSACRADRALVLALAACAAASPAAAQAPVRLFPAEPPSAQGPIELKAPEQAPSAAVQPAPLGGRSIDGPAPAGRSIDGIEVRDLRAPSFESVGVIDQRRGGFGPAMWSGTPASVVRALLPRIPDAGDSLVLNSLARRLLLSAATAPEGAGQTTGAPSLVALRAERLMALGDVDGVTALAKAAPTAASGPLLTRMEVDALLVLGETERACEAAEAALAAGFDGELSKVRVLCTFARGDVLAGNMGLDLLRERKETDPAFVAATEVLGGLPPVPADKLTLAEPKPVHVAAFAGARQPLPKFDPAAVPAAVLRAIAVNGALPSHQRLAAAEAAEAVGAVEAEFVRKLYADIPFTPDELSTAIPSAQAGKAEGQALLFRAAQDMPDPGVRAQLIARALDLAAAKGRFASAARVFEPVLAELPSEPPMAAFAPLAARAFHALGRLESAGRWVDVARTGEDARAADRLWPFAAVMAAGGNMPISTPAYAAWRATLEGLPPEQAARRAAIVLGLLSSLGAKVPDAAWADTLGLARGEAPFGPVTLMRSGAAEARPGITVLAALAALGERPLSQADPLVLAEVVRSLALAGLAVEARSLAVEALLANSI